MNKKKIVLFADGFVGEKLVRFLLKGFKDQMWIEKKIDLNSHHNDLTAREASLASALQYKGNWQSELIKSGFNFTLISSMVQKNLIVKTKRKKLISPKLSSFVIKKTSQFYKSRGTFNSFQKLITKLPKHESKKRKGEKGMRLRFTTTLRDNIKITR